MKLAYYNEIEPYAAEWLRRLILFGLIAPGDVDERDMRDVNPDDLRGYRQCHFFAGIGVWSHALRLAGWDDHRQVWTGSCPCQPFSAAGRGLGVADERHLWPHWHHLIRERRPPIVFGEQVASKDGLGWFDLVRSDLEGEGYAVGAADLCAAGVGAPHIRQRLWFVADAMYAGRAERRAFAGHGSTARCGATGLVADADAERHDRSRARGAGRDEFADCGDLGLVADADDAGSQGRLLGRDGSDKRPVGPGGVAGGLGDAKRDGREVALQPIRRSFATGGVGETGVAGMPSLDFWSGAEWLPCRDGKARPTQPGLFPLAHGASARVGRLRAYGNAIVPQVAATFIAAAMEVRP